MSTSSAVDAARPPRRRFLSLFPMLATSSAALTAAPAAVATAGARLPDPVVAAWSDRERARTAFEIVDRITRETAPAEEWPDHWYNASNKLRAATDAAIECQATSLAGIEIKLAAIRAAFQENRVDHDVIRLLDSVLCDVRRQMEA